MSGGKSPLSISSKNIPREKKKKNKSAAPAAEHTTNTCKPNTPRSKIESEYKFPCTSGFEPAASLDGFYKKQENQYEEGENGQGLVGRAKRKKREDVKEADRRMIWRRKEGRPL